MSKTVKASSTPDAPAGAPGATAPPAAEPTAPEVASWFDFIEKEPPGLVRHRFIQEATDVLARHKEVVDAYACMWLFDPEGSIGPWSADQIFKALLRGNKAREKDVALLILSKGGRVESAYQIAKLCQRYSKTGFAVAVPRQAKSAATLISLGATTIHMGPLGELGPIDPQLGDLPALGVVQALKTIAEVAEQHPGSSTMFAQYLEKVLTVEQIGYCERIGESAVQYAERLLAPKTGLPRSPGEIARELVYEYKHHGFVIDLEEAQGHLGTDWIVGESPVLELAEEFYRLFEEVDLWLRLIRHHRLTVVGDIEYGTTVLRLRRDE